MENPSPLPAPGSVAGPTSPAPGAAPSAAAPAPGGIDWQAEAKAAFAARDEAKARARDLEARLTALEARGTAAPSPSSGSAGDGKPDAAPAKPGSVEELIRRQERRDKIAALEQAFAAAGGLEAMRPHVRALEHVWGSAVKVDADGIVTGVAEAIHALRAAVPPFFGAPPSSPASAPAGQAGAALNLNTMRPGELTAAVRANPQTLDAVLAQLGHKPKSGMRL